MIAKSTLSAICFALLLTTSAGAQTAKQDEERKVFNREITLRCVTNGQAIVAAQDAEQQRLVLQAQEQREINR